MGELEPGYTINCQDRTMRLVNTWLGPEQELPAGVGFGQAPATPVLFGYTDQVWVPLRPGEPNSGLLEDLRGGRFQAVAESPDQVDAGWGRVEAQLRQAGPGSVAVVMLRIGDRPEHRREHSTQVFLDEQGQLHYVDQVRELDPDQVR